MQKTTIVLIYGGRSTEHEVSRRSAAFVVRNLDYSRFQLQAIGITSDGIWYPQDIDELQETSGPQLPLAEESRDLTPEMRLLQPITSRKALQELNKLRDQTVVFPMIHGSGGEDGVLQGLCELNDLAYVGPDVLGSAIGMDKIISKRLVHEAGLPIVPYASIRKGEWEQLKDRKSWCLDLGQKLKWPLFVKPVSLGSSVGVAKASHEGELIAAIDQACRFDDHILIESGLEVREIEFACLGGYDPDLTSAGEIVTTQGFYDYEAKYLSETAAEVKVPADLTTAQIETGRNLAKQAYQALHIYGLARVDLFLEKSTDRFYFNEVNTIPGFTSISQFPMLWAHSGIAAKDLLNRLIQSAMQRNLARSQLQRKR